MVTLTQHQVLTCLSWSWALCFVVGVLTLAIQLVGFSLYERVQFRILNFFNCTLEL